MFEECTLADLLCGTFLWKDLQQFKIFGEDSTSFCDGGNIKIFHTFQKLL